MRVLKEEMERVVRAKDKQIARVEAELLTVRNEGIIHIKSL